MNILKITLLFIALFVCFRSSEAQGWEKIYSNVTAAPNAGIKKFLPTTGGFLLLVADGDVGAGSMDFHILKIDGAGTVLWTRHYDFGGLEVARDMIATSDGGYAVLYQAYQPNSWAGCHWVKLDAGFNVVFNKTVAPGPPAGEMKGEQLIENQQSISVFGTISTPSSGDTRGFCRQYDLSGDETGYAEWLAQASSFRAATVAPNGDLVALSDGYGSNFDDYKIFVTRMAPDLSQNLWTQTVTETGVNYQGGAIVPATDGGFLVAGARNGFGALLHLGEDGAIQWQQDFPYHPNPDSLNVLGLGRVAATTDGSGYWVTGQTNSYIPRIVLIRTDPGGQPLFHRVLGAYAAYNFALDLAGLADGGCLVAGSRSLIPFDAYQHRPMAIRTDSEGFTYYSGLTGQMTADIDGDCIGDTDTLLSGFTVIAWQNGAPVTSGTVGQQGLYQMTLDTGNYLITPDKPNNAWIFCPDTIFVAIQAGDTLSNIDFAALYQPQPVDSIFGTVFEDVDGDCFRDSFETAYPGWTIAAIVYDQGQTQTFVAVTDSAGHFNITGLNGIDNTAIGTFSISPPAGDGLNCRSACPDSYDIRFLNSNSFEANFGMHCDSLPPCPLIEVDIATVALRPCFNSTYHIHYCNDGSVTAENARVQITVDPVFEVTGSSLPWSSTSGNVYTFDLGDLSPEQCGDFTIDVFLPCSEPVGATYCIEAHAYPDTVCTAPGANWDGSRIEVTAACTDSTIVFTIRNAGAGDMQNPLDYIVIEDNVLLMQGGSFQLSSGQSQQVVFPANGSFFRLEAEQAPGFPGLGIPVAWAEGCGGGNVSLGFVNQYPLGDNDPWQDVFCLESVQSYDPNDKQAFPRGYAGEHYIGQNTNIEYMIRFQNTGTAPAINVEIRDTLPVQWLDPASVRPGAGSHPYEWDMQGNGVVVFRFPGINLPDSSAGWAASQGFVKFTVSQKKDVAIGTKIGNRAAIYFDFNAPVITNRTFHTVGDNFITVGTQTPSRPGARVSVVPNPAAQTVHIQLESAKNGEQRIFRLFSALGGDPVLEQTFAGTAGDFPVGRLPGGLYFYEIRIGGEVMATGRLVKM